MPIVSSRSSEPASPCALSPPNLAPRFPAICRESFSSFFLILSQLSMTRILRPVEKAASFMVGPCSSSPVQEPTCCTRLRLDVVSTFADMRCPALQRDHTWAGLALCYPKNEPGLLLPCCATWEAICQARPPRALLHGIAEPIRHQPVLLAMREVGDLLTRSPSGGICWNKYRPPRALVSPRPGPAAGHPDIRRLRSPRRG